MNDHLCAWCLARGLIQAGSRVLGLYFYEEGKKAIFTGYLCQACAGQLLPGYRWL